MCDTSEPAQALFYCDPFPDYRVSSLNIGLTSHISCHMEITHIYISGVIKNLLRLWASQHFFYNYSTQDFLNSRSDGQSSQWPHLNSKNYCQRGSWMKCKYNYLSNTVAKEGILIYHGMALATAGGLVINHLQSQVVAVHCSSL